MNHHVVWALLDEFLDGALAADARWAVTAHLDDCVVCRTQVATQARLRGMVRERLTAIEPPPGLSDRLSSALAAEPIVPSTAARRSWSPLPMRIVALLGPALAALWLMALLIMPASQPGADLTSELAAIHTLFAQDESMLDVVGDAAIVSTWFWDEFGLQVTTPEIGPYSLVGGRLIALDGRPVAQLVYEGKPDKVYLSLVQFKHTGADLGQMEVSDGIALGQQGTTTLVSWIAGEDRVALIGALPGSELRRLAGNLTGRPNDSESSSP